ncbi:MAG: hypothetical protein HYW65_00185 [Candidatus Liptonbacteria bacterium]|nr:hypothetical protein [Candidatus Liptonbacteria bacterium]
MEDKHLTLAFTLAGGIIVSGLIFFVVWRGSIGAIPPAPMREEVAGTGTAPAPLSPAPALASLRWDRMPSSTVPWEARDSHAFAVFKNALWLMGGLDGNGLVARGQYGEHVRYWEAPHFDDVWTSTNGYDWKRITNNAPWGERRSMQAVEFRGKLWLMGGWGPELGYRSDVWATEDGKRWQRVTAKAAWPAREGHSLLVWRDKLWLIGGVQYDARKTFNDVWNSTDGFTWELVTDNPPWRSRWDHAAASFNDRLYLTAGMDLAGNTFRDVWVSDDGATWELVTDNPPWRERQGHVLLEYRGALWTLGRLNDPDSGGGPNDVWFTKDGVTWEETDVDPPWRGREDHGAVVWRDAMWITGGMDSKWEWSNEVWRSSFAQ